MQISWNFANMLRFSQDIILENERLIMRPLEASDLALLLPYAIEEPHLWQYSLVPANGIEAMTDYVRKAIENRHLETEYTFIIFDKIANAYAGSTRFYNIQTKHSTMQIGYTWCGSIYQGTGLNKHCKYLMLQYAFEQCFVERIEFKVDINNLKSIKALSKLGCTIEGVLRNNILREDGCRRDTVVLSILREEWNKIIAPKLWHELNYKPQNNNGLQAENGLMLP